MANQVILHTPTWGYAPLYPAGDVATQTVNAAGTWAACSFVLDAAKTLNAAKLYFSAVGGTVQAANITLSLCADNSGVPNHGSIIEARGCDANAAVGWNRWSGFTTALSARTLYWLIVKNLQGTPGTNFPTLRRFGTSGSGGIGHLTQAVPGNANWGWSHKATLNSGTAWATNAVGGTAMLMLEFSDGSYAGIPVHNVALDGTNTAYSTRESGVVVPVPTNQPPMNVIGVTMPLSVSGTPGNLRYRLYRGSTPTLIGTTDALANANHTNEIWHPLLFSATQKVYPGDILRVVAGVVSGGDSSNFWRLYKYDIENSAMAKALTPFGNCKQTYYNGTSWTDTDTSFFAFALLLDPQNPFDIAAVPSVMQ